MNGFKSLRNFVGRNRHLMTPDQALQADKKVLDANVHVPSRPATEEEIVAQKTLHDPDWYKRNEEWYKRTGKNEPTTAPLYPTAESQTPLPNPVEASQTPTIEQGEGRV